VLIHSGNHGALELYSNTASACSHKSTFNCNCNSCLCYHCPLILLWRAEWGHPGAVCCERRTAVLREILMALVPRSPHDVQRELNLQKISS